MNSTLDSEVKVPAHPGRRMQGSWECFRASVFAQLPLLWILTVTDPQVPFRSCKLIHGWQLPMLNLPGKHQCSQADPMPTRALPVLLGPITSSSQTSLLICKRTIITCFTMLLNKTSYIQPQVQAKQIWLDNYMNPFSGCGTSQKAILS